MGHIITGLDRSKLQQLAPAYAIEFDRILPYLSLYERELLKQQQAQQKEG